MSAIRRANGRTSARSCSFTAGSTIDSRGYISKVPELLDLGIQIADALEAAHVKGIVHRDIKPENIIIVSGRPVKVLNFGLAKVMPAAVTENRSGDQSLTLEGVIAGTPAYVSRTGPR